jgi:hypothetical protein
MITIYIIFCGLHAPIKNIYYYLKKVVSQSNYIHYLTGIGPFGLPKLPTLELIKNDGFSLYLALTYNSKCLNISFKGF